MEQYKLRFISLGGIVGVTKNMYVYELYVKTQNINPQSEEYTLKDIIIVDCGIGFPMEKELGVDFVIPDISYLKDKVNKIRAVLISHGHEDHTSALPFHYADLGSPPIYSSNLTCSFIEQKMREFDIRAKTNRVDYDKEYAFGDFRIKFIHVTHSIPDTCHILIKTPVGTIYHGPDFKFDLTPPYGEPPNFYEITKAGHEGVLCLLSDCLGSEREGLTLSEAIVGQTFEDAMRKTKGKFIMTTFSSNISRIRQCVEAAIKFNRKIVFLGRSMKQNTRMAQEINYLPIPYNLIGTEEEVMTLPPNKVCLIVAGSQGQYGSALSKLATKQNKNIKLKPGDKVIISSDPIPGNENEVYALIEELTMQGADVIYSDIQDQLHASGHGNQEDLKMLMRFTNPKYFIPIGGSVRHQRQYRKLAIELGFKESSVFTLDEGNSVWFTKNKAFEGDPIETKNIYVDAYGIGDVGNVVLRDRKTLATDGIVMTVLPINSSGKLAGTPKIFSKGFVFEKVGGDLFKGAIDKIEKELEGQNNGIQESLKLKREIITVLEEYFRAETGRKPLVVVETIEI